MHRIFLVVGALLSASPAWAATQWVQQEAEVVYKVVHPFHTVEGVSKQVDVVALVDGDVLKVMARAPVASFDSGNSNRDAHMQEVVDAPQFPTVTVRLMMSKFTLPAAGAEQAYTIPGEIELHGVKVKASVDAKIKAVNAQSATLTFELTDSLEAHHIERPELLFKKLEDAMRVHGRSPCT